MFNKLLISLRPKQWVKNIIIFAPLVFSQSFFNLSASSEVLLAFCVFCIITGAVYLLNDLLDIEKDRQHPIKSHRPLASGELKPGLAVFCLILIAPGAILAAFLLNLSFGVFTTLYFLINLAYSMYLKNVVIVDVMLIAFGFVLRVLAGAAVIDVPATPWLLMCTILLALFLGFAKRRHELVLLDDQAEEHRKVLVHYTPYFLDQMIIIVSSATVMSYALYTIWPDTVANFGTNKLIYTGPFVLYGLFRYLYLVHMREEGGSPTRVLLTDKPLLVNILGWLICVMLIIERVI